jgi:hypothetical protein
MGLKLLCVNSSWLVRTRARPTSWIISLLTSRQVFFTNSSCWAHVLLWFMMTANDMVILPSGYQILYTFLHHFTPRLPWLAMRSISPTFHVSRFSSFIDCTRARHDNTCRFPPLLLILPFISVYKPNGITFIVYISYFVDQINGQSFSQNT